jgi:inorganic triphosphatase YgiF
LETELKFEVDAAGAKALSRHLDLGDLGRPRALRSVYYDTPETDLRDHGLTLRVRDDGKRRIQTVKKTALGGSGFHRGEWESVLGRSAEADLAPDLDTALKTPVGAVLNRRELGFLRPVFEVEIHRITRSVEVEGSVIEIALDRGSARAADRTAPIGELELELKSGAPSALFALARTCAGVAPLALSFVSKSARGYALLDEGEPAAAAASNSRLGRKDTSGEAFRSIAGGTLTQIAANARLLSTSRRPEALHQLRVGVRRLRTAISLFRPMLDDAVFEAVRAELRWLAGELNGARDLDVFIQAVFQPAFESDPDLIGLQAFGDRLQAARLAAYDSAQAAVRSGRFHALMLSTLAWIETGAWSLTDDAALTALRDRPVLALAAHEFHKRRRKIVKAGRDLARMSPEQRHALRIKAKRLRYACGFFESLYRGKAAKAHGAFSIAARELQERLGALTDIAFSRDLATRVAQLETRPDPRAAFAAGVLAGRAAAPAEAGLKAAKSAFAKLARAKAFW